MNVQPLPSIDVERASRDALIRHIDDLEMRLETLVAADGEIAALRQTFGMTHQEALIAAALATGRLCTRERFMAVSGRWKEEIGERTMDVPLSRVRQKLRPHGIDIVNLFGEGWKIGPGAAARLRLVMKGGPA